MELNEGGSVKLSIISPAYNEEDVLPYFFERGERVCESLLKCGDIKDYEIIIVNDGSMDTTWDIIKENHKRNPKIKGVKFSRNFGHHSAILAGLDHANGDLVVYMDSDLQAQPEDIPKLLKEFSKGFNMVWGVAKKREDNFVIRLGSKFFYGIFNKITGVRVPKQPIMAGASKLAAKHIKQLREIRQFSLAQWTYVGLKTSYIEVDKKERFKGEIKYNWAKRFNLALDGIVGFSKFPLKISSYLGFVMSFVGFSFGIYMICKKLIFGGVVPGYTSIIATITFLFGVLFLILGIIGEYMGIIIDEVKKRPIYIVEEVLS